MNVPGIIPVTTRKSGTRRGIISECTASSLCVFFKGTSSRTHKKQARNGVSSYLALTFGTLLSSQGTEAAIETVSPAPPGFPFVVFPTLSDPFRRLTPSQRGLSFRPFGRSDE